MSTRSSIAVSKDGKVKTVYCHFDGYLDGVGETLLKHYNSQERADAIVSLGDLSALDESVEKPEGHAYGSKAEGCSVFYGRDRGESDVDAREFDTYKEAIEWNNQEYNYLWDGKQWLVDGEVLTKELIETE